MAENSSLKASPENTPKVIQEYNELTEKTLDALTAEGCIYSSLFSPVAEILVTTKMCKLIGKIGCSWPQSERTTAESLCLNSLTGDEHIFCFMEQNHTNNVYVLKDQRDKENNKDLFSSPMDFNWALTSKRVFVGIESRDKTQDIYVPDLVGGERNNYCDAMVTTTDQGKWALVVMTADCLPLLLCDPKAKVVAAVHCGWKGLSKKIISCTIAQMQSLGAKTNNILAYMGPAIGPRSFEVGKDVYDRFVGMNPIFESAFIPEMTKEGKGRGKLVPCEGKFLCNLYELCRIELKQLGVKPKSIQGGEFDTYLQNQLFYSYRRDNGAKERIASILYWNS